MSGDEIRLLVGTLAAIVSLVGLITRLRISPFIALMVASVMLAVIAGLDLGIAMNAFSTGLGGLLASTALVIALGAILGSLLADSGGADVIATRLTQFLGVKRLGWTMFFVGTVVGIGVWFTVGLVLLAPIAITLVRMTRQSLLVPACALLAGLSAMHGLAPPHPGPIAAIELVGADLAGTIVLSLVVGVIAGAIAGPIYWSCLPGRLIGGTELASTVVETEGVDRAPLAATQREDAPLSDALSPNAPNTLPSPLTAIGLVLLPVVMMVVGSAANSLFAAELGATSNFNVSSPDDSASWGLELITFLGDPSIAMLISVLAAYWLLGVRRGRSATQLAALTERSLAPVAGVLLIVGAGAGFSRVLIASGAGESIALLAERLPLTPLVLAWLLAAAVRVATGSATTAITTAAGLAGALVEQHASINRELLVLAMGAGSLTLSHVNDGGFWFVKEYFGLTVQDTLRTWTVLETVLSITALLIVLFLDLFI